MDAKAIANIDANVNANVNANANTDAANPKIADAIPNVNANANANWLKLLRRVWHQLFVGPPQNLLFSHRLVL